MAQQAGRAELGEDTFGTNFNELHVNLKESNRRRDEVVADVRHRLEDIYGFAFSIKQFISERIEEVLSGTTATIVVKLFGSDLEVLQEKAKEIQTAMAGVRGVADLNLEQQTGVPKVLVRFNREALAPQIHKHPCSPLCEKPQGHSDRIPRSLQAEAIGLYGPQCSRQRRALFLVCPDLSVCF